MLRSAKINDNQPKFEGEKTMTELNTTEVQSRLWELQSRRGQIESDIIALSQCINQMTGIIQAARIQISQFREASRRDQINWRGQQGTNYNTSRNHSRANADTYTRALQAQLEDVSQFRSHLSNQLTDLSVTIRGLEQLIHGGV